MPGFFNLSAWLTAIARSAVLLVVYRDVDGQIGHRMVRVAVTGAGTGFIQPRAAFASSVTHLVMARVSMPVEAGNRAISNGTIGNLMQGAAERWKPDAMLLTTFDGRRPSCVTFDLPAASDMPPFAEPFFSGLDADLELAPMMNSGDLPKGLSRLG